jgi:DNA invertase Pin-like site-specific DNA recombinase
MEKAIGYCRVSTDRQDLEAQKNAINEVGAKKGYTVEFITEKISSRKKERVIYELLNEIEEGTTLIVYESSRLARSTTELFSIIQKLKEKKCNFHLIKPELFVKHDGTELYAEAILFAMGISSQIERELISARTKNALAHKKKEGVILGRPPGLGEKVQKQLAEKNLNKEFIISMQKAGLSTVKLADLVGVNRLTMRSYLKNIK